MDEITVPYSVEEAEMAANENAMDPYHRELILYLCDFIRKFEINDYVYALEWQDDPYESGWHLVSLHKTKYGCFKQMTKTANQAWYTDRTLDLQFGKNKYWPLFGQRWKIRKVFLNK